MGKNHFPLKIIFLFFFAKQRKMGKLFSMKMIFTPAKHTLRVGMELSRLSLQN